MPVLLVISPLQEAQTVGLAQLEPTLKTESHVSPALQERFLIMLLLNVSHALQDQSQILTTLVVTTVMQVITKTVPLPVLLAP